ncbi:MAG TPA: hypothetical protein VF461_23210 [Gemmatimonadaceae bacterium]
MSEREPTAPRISGATRILEALPEAKRNHLLRRSDWRYLLPDAAPALALCLGDTELFACCEVIAREVHDAPKKGVRYDLVVAENPSRRELRRMAAAMSPSGACYTEWTRVAPLGPARLRRRLAAARFHDATTYRPWPSLSPCRAWVPTHGGAARHHWRGVTRSTRVRREKVSGLLSKLLAPLGAHSRLCVVALGAEANRLPQLVSVARERSAWPDDSIEHGGMLLLTPGDRVVGKVVALAFDRGGAPALAIKTARTRDSGRGLHREAEMLDAVAALHPRGMPGVPRLHFLDALLGRPILGETALAGVPLAATLTRGNYRRAAERVTDWLIALAEPAREQPPEATWETLVSPAFERFTSEFGSVVGESQLARTREILGGLGALPVVCEQRDFSPWNVFEGDRGIVVLDWESGEPRGLPLLDLVYFATHSAYYLKRAWVTGRYVDAHRAAWSRRTALGRANHKCVARYLAHFELDPALLRPLRLFAWVLHAHSDFLHIRADAGGAPDEEALLSSRFLQLFRADLEELAK